MSIQSFKCKQVFEKKTFFIAYELKAPGHMIFAFVGFIEILIVENWVVIMNLLFLIDNMTVWAYDIRPILERSKSMPRVHMSSRTNCFFLMKNKLHRNILLRIHWFSKTFREWNYRQFYLDQVNQFFSGIRFIWTIYYSHHM